MKKVLNASEMKLVRGGASPSNYCAPGEKLYSCTTTYDNGFESTGKVCSSSGAGAGDAVIAQRKAEGAPTISSVACA